ncbi:LLM class flavin-dependent oxidoreductase [Actinacidiphila glaucinigra]|nr:LLM class flavin-dependent oxidoreductase [Actinacidiphila glaucinigra]
MRDALAATVATARRAAEPGVRRVRVAEHHGYRSVGSVAPPVLPARLAASTPRIRAGSGGVLPTNHAPRAVAEHFTTLAALHPGRVDLGIGRGPGTDDLDTVRALRRGGGRATDDEYRAGLVERLALLGEPTAGACRREPTRFPNRGCRRRASRAPNWPQGWGCRSPSPITSDRATRWRRWAVTGSGSGPHGGTGAPRAGERGDGLRGDRRRGRPSRPPRDARHGGGAEAPLLSPEKAAAESISAGLEERLLRIRATRAYGIPDEVRRRLSAVASQTAADELMLSTPVHDPNDRTRSLSLAAGRA